MVEFVRENPLLSFFGLAIAGSWLLWAPWYLGQNGIGFIGWEFSDAVVILWQVLGLLAGPFLAALVVTRLVDGPGAPLALLGRMIQWRENPLWYVVALVAVPIAVGAGYITAVGSPGTPSISWSLATLVLMFVGLLALGPIQEEIGWRGFALPRLQRQMHPALAATALGLFVFLWQLPMMVTHAWHMPYHGFADIGVYVLFLIATSIVLSTLRNVSHGSLLFSVLAYNGINWALFAAPLLTSEPVHHLMPATLGMWLLALTALLLTGGRLGADVPESRDTPLDSLAAEAERVDDAETRDPAGV